MNAYMDIETITMDNMQQNDASRPTTPIGIGAQLKTAREAMRLTEKEAAARLHLSSKFILIIENEEFNNAPPATFMRGYLRSYAKLLNFPEKEINDAITRLGMNTPPTKVATPMLHTPLEGNNERYVRWITYLVAFILVALVGVWWTSHPHESSEHNKTLPLPQMAAPNPAPAAAPLNLSAPANTNIPSAMNTTNPQQQPAAAMANTSPAATSPAPIAVAPVNTANAQPNTLNNTPATPNTLVQPGNPVTPTPATPDTAKEPPLQMAVPEPGLDTNDW
jgi:cytoskeleton protein RodZ